MLHVGLHVSRHRLDVHVLDPSGEAVEVTVAAPDAGGVGTLAAHFGEAGRPVRAVIESMNGARFVHDRLDRAGRDVAIADAQKVRGSAPLACKSDRIDS